MMVMMMMMMMSSVAGAATTARSLSRQGHAHARRPSDHGPPPPPGSAARKAQHDAQVHRAYAYMRMAWGIAKHATTFTLATLPPPEFPLSAKAMAQIKHFLRFGGGSEQFLFPIVQLLTVGLEHVVPKVGRLGTKSRPGHKVLVVRS